MMENKVYQEVCEILEDEMKKIVKKGDITPQELEVLYKASSIVLDFDTREAMKKTESDSHSMEYRHSQHYPPDMWMSYGNSYEANEMSHEQWNSNHDGESHRRGRDERTGRYVSRDSGRSYDERDYSKTTESERMIQKLEDMIANAKDERVKKAIDQCIDRISR